MNYNNYNYNDYGSYDPNEYGNYDPNAVNYDPNAVNYDPNAVNYDPNAITYDENGVTYDENGINYDPNINYDESAYDPNNIPLPVEGQWMKQSTISSPAEYEPTRRTKSYTVQSLEYETNREVLWASYESCRVTSYLIENPINEEWDRANPRYSSFTVSDTSLTQVISELNYIVSVTPDKVGLHSDGGLIIGHYNVPKVHETKSDSLTFSCATLLRPSGALVTSTDIDGPTHLVAATNSNYIFAFDMRTMEKPPQLTVNVGCSTLCIRTSNGSKYVVAGGSDGKIRLLDGRLRNANIIHVFDAHTGPVRDFCLQPDGNLMLSCGFISRSVNPTDSKQSVKNINDPLVKLFDLRNNRLLNPLTMSVSSASFVRFVPSYRGDGTSSALLVAESGILQICDIHGKNLGSTQVLYAPLVDRRDKITSVAVSSSGQLLCVGTTSGIIFQYTVGLQEGSTISKVNIMSQSFFPPSIVPSPPLKAIPVNSRSLATSYTMKTEMQLEPTLSSFMTTPKIFHKKLRFSSGRKISNDLLKNVSQKDFIGTVPNPGCLANNVIFGKTSHLVYDYCDPRKKIIESGSVVIETCNTPNHLRRVMSPKGKNRMNFFDYSAYNKTKFIGLENSCLNSYTNPLLQFLYAIPEVRSAALASQMSLYHHVNPITLLCEFGFLFHMMRNTEIWNVTNPQDLVSKIVIPANFQRTFQQVPEAVALSLFDGSITDTQLLIQTFCRFVFQQLQTEHEFENNKSSKEPRVLGASRIKNSITSDDKQSAVDYIFGHTVATSTTFLQSGSIEFGVPNRASIVEINYPAPKRPRPGQVLKVIPFSVLLWGSLQKESFKKGWCSTSESYEPFKQVRSLMSFPRILTLSCGDTQRDPKEATISGALGENLKVGSMHLHHWSKTNSIGGSWLPVEIEVAIHRINVEEIKNGVPIKNTVTTLIVSEKLLKAEDDSSLSNVDTWIIYDGVNETVTNSPASAIESCTINVADENWDVASFNMAAVISQVISPDQNNNDTKHLLLHMKQLMEEKGDAKWVMFNDFVVMESNVYEATTFDSYRHPCLIFFSQKGYENNLLLNSISSPNFPKTDVDNAIIPSSVLQLNSLSQTSSIRLPSLTSLPGPGDLIAFDGEFVSVEAERATINAEGQRVVTEEGRQVLARISLVDGGPFLVQQNVPKRPMRVLTDDYILSSESVVDYVTRFSGIVAEDLSPSTSKHAVVTNRTAYLKLRYFLDKKCIFVGHGLQKDFETANLFVPPNQIRDTVDLWRLPNQRKISLRFLASHLLNADIQDEIHDSIEDAKTALLLYRHYESANSEGNNHLMKILKELYTIGNNSNWSSAQLV